MSDRMNNTNYEDRGAEDIVLKFTLGLIFFVVAFFIILFFETSCYPAPSNLERAVFYTLIALIFLETVFSGLFSYDFDD